MGTHHVILYTAQLKMLDLNLNSSEMQSTMKNNNERWFQIIIVLKILKHYLNKIKNVKFSQRINHCIDNQSEKLGGIGELRLLCNLMKQIGLGLGLQAKEVRKHIEKELNVPRYTTLVCHQGYPTGVYHLIFA